MEEIISDYGDTAIGLIGGLAIVGLVSYAILSPDGAMHQMILSFVKDILG